MKNIVTSGENPGQYLLHCLNHNTFYKIVFQEYHDGGGGGDGGSGIVKYRRTGPYILRPSNIVADVNSSSILSLQYNGYDAVADNHGRALDNSANESKYDAISLRAISTTVDILNDIITVSYTHLTLPTKRIV